MTREQKLALIVGFALVLVVGVLISDQMSVARRSVDPATATGNGLAAALEPGGEFTPGLGRQLEQRSDSYAGATRTIVDPHVLVLDNDLGFGAQPNADNGPTSLADAALQGLTNGARAVGDLIVDGQNGGIVAMGIDPVDPTPGIEMGQPIDLQDRGATQTETRFVPQSFEAQPKPVEKPREPVRAVKTHRVQENETLWSIAKKYYGDGELATELAKYNAGRVGKGNVIHAGASLLIPDRSELGGVAPSTTKTTAVAEKNTKPASTAKKPETKTTETPKTTTYTVKSGDTLQKISQKFFGTTRRWTEIVEINRGVIDDEDNVKVGTVITLPSR